MSEASEKILAERLLALFWSLQRGASDQTCLVRWSSFIRTRDGYACLICGSSTRISAHHICRKSFLKEACFEPGNGVTLCASCHREAHEGFNGRPNLQLPMDAEGGEKIEKLAELYALLANASLARENKNPYFYYLSKRTLKRFKMFQGFAPNQRFCGTRIQQAAIIWRSPPNNIIQALIAKNFSSSELNSAVYRIAASGELMAQTLRPGGLQIIVNPSNPPSSVS